VSADAPVKPSAEMRVPPGAETVDFHTGSGDVVIRAWDDHGEELAVRAAIEIDDGLHEVVLVPGTVRLTAEPAPEPPAEQLPETD
jgi:hypothetical protein